MVSVEDGNLGIASRQFKHRHIVVLCIDIGDFPEVVQMPTQIHRDNQIGCENSYFLIEEICRTLGVL